MTHTLRRSKSKYGRTRRQRRKQKRTQGGGLFDEFVNKFKPSSPEEKCEKAKKDAEEVCSSISQEMPSSTPPQSELDSGFPESPESPSVTSEPESAITEPLQLLPAEPMASESNVTSSTQPASAAPAQPMIQGNESVVPLEPQMPSTISGSDSVAQFTQNATPAASASPDQKYNGSGGTKSKRKNKKQNRRKKMKSRKHKK